MSLDRSDDVEEDIEGKPQGEPEWNVPRPSTDVEVTVFGLTCVLLCGNNICRCFGSFNFVTHG